MPRLSLWWALLLLFALTIGGIQSLGLWTRPRPAPARAASGAGASTTAAARHQNAEARHWRALFMQH